MFKSVSENIRRMVKEVYSNIAGEFDITRKRPWEEFEYFNTYISKGDKVLDLGCGNGRLYGSLLEKEVHYTGLDNNESQIEKARENFPEVRFETGDMADLIFADSSFDAVIAIASFHHIPGRKLRKRTVAEMKRVLKPGGVLILTVWNLFQIKYIGCFLRSFASFLLHLGIKYAWNDLWIPWGNHPVKRYYHAFLPVELMSYFREGWEVKEVFFSRKGKKVSFLRCYNICAVMIKIQ